MSTQTIFRVVNPNKSYTKLSNVLLDDCEISFACKGFLVSVLKLPTDWTFNVTWLMNKFGIKKDATYKLIREAGERGYCKKVEHRRKNGTLARLEYHFSDDPADFNVSQGSVQLPEISEADEKPSKTQLPEKSGSCETRHIQRTVTTTNNNNNPPTPLRGDPPKAKKGSRLPEDWRLSVALEAWTREYTPRAWPDLERRIALEVDQFCDYWAGVPGQKGLKLDWDRTWRNSWRRYCEREIRGSGQRNGHAYPTNFDRKIEATRRCRAVLAGMSTPELAP